MGQSIHLDVRGMDPPGPILKVMDTLGTMAKEDCLVLTIDCRPAPLYRILERNGYSYDEQPGRESNYEITIRLRAGS